jgi:hypothetical protein
MFLAALTVNTNTTKILGSLPPSSENLRRGKGSYAEKNISKIGSYTCTAIIMNKVSKNKFLYNLKKLKH